MTELPPYDIGVADELPLDPDVDASEDIRHRQPDNSGPFQQGRPGRWPRFQPGVLVAIFAGGVGGGLARHALTEAWPTPAHAFPWATFVVNTTGAFALALLLVVLAEVWAPRRYLRQLLGTGFLGAFTTFSSVVTATDQLAAHGHPRTATIYLVGSLLAALGATSFGLLFGRAIAASRHRGRPATTRRRP